MNVDSVTRSRKDIDVRVKGTNVKKYAIAMLAISSPAWFPLLGAYVIELYGHLTKTHTSSFDETAIMLIVLGSFFLGNVMLANVANLSRGQEFFLLLFYSIVAIVFLFFTGWGALMILGHY